MSLGQANNHLAIKLYSMLAADKQNVFFSPCSISVAMTMLLCAAEGKTASEISSALGYDDIGISALDAVSIFKEQLKLSQEQSDSPVLACANAVLSRKGVAIKDAYQKILGESFGAIWIQTDAEDSLHLVNDFVKGKTNDMIPELLQQLPVSSALVLLNVIYFKGMWMRQFKKEETCIQAFYNDEMMKEVDMMHITHTFPFHEEETLQILQLPYIGQDIAMLIFLPREKDGLRSIESNLSPNVVTESKEKLHEKTVEVSLPRFRVDYTRCLVECFSDLGVKRAFIPGAEFGVASDSPELSVYDISHTAVLVITEEGSEAGAVTTVAEADGAPMGANPVFCVDHPFYFLIYDTKSDVILFMGRVNELGCYEDEEVN